ncbi:MAG: hypothetical protein Q8L64_01550 [bacterium]|nr:hypothetical protein [bacterium]
MKNLYLIIFFVTIFCLQVFFPAFGQYLDRSPETYSPPENIRNIMLLENEFPWKPIKMGPELKNRGLSVAGWQPFEKPRIWEDIVIGISQNFIVNTNLCGFIKYGFFEKPEYARKGAITSIIHHGPEFYHFWPEGSFSGVEIGDHTFRWEFMLEKNVGFLNPDYVGDRAILSFCKGKYAVMIMENDDSLPVGLMDKTVLENLAKKCEKKIDVATLLDNFGAELPTLITNQGILRSLQAKLDVFTKNYRKGEYKTALKNINAFVNELDAQRGKHVSEQAYQTLKTYAETIITNVNSLM